MRLFTWLSLRIGVLTWKVRDLAKHKRSLPLPVWVTLCRGPFAVALESCPVGGGLFVFFGVGFLFLIFIEFIGVTLAKKITGFGCTVL